jgi:hypothetical protein
MTMPAKQQELLDEKNAQVRFLNDDVAIVAHKANERVTDRVPAS